MIEVKEKNLVTGRANEAELSNQPGKHEDAPDTAAGAPAAGTATAVAKVDARIFLGKAEADQAKFLVVLRERADLSMAAGIPTRLARRRFVYETLHAHAEATQARLRRRLEGAGVRFRQHFLVNMIEVEADQAFARELAASVDVASIERDAPARVDLPNASRRLMSAATAPAIEPNIVKVRAPELWQRGYRGQGIVIGIADSGFQWEHPALKRQYRGWNGAAVSHEYNWHDAVHDAVNNPCGSDTRVPCDDAPGFGHGTGTSGLAVGDDGAGSQIGVAPEARLIGCRNMDQGNGTPARYTECFEWLLAPTDWNGENPRPDLGADVINNSWYCPAAEGCTDPQILRTVVESVRAAGVAVVVAAGNYGFACGNLSDAPAIYDASFTIGSTDNEDRVTSFSNPGPVTIDGSARMKPDMCAPGVSLRTAARDGSYTSAFTGTSGSTPQVAGAMALLWSAVPGLADDLDATEHALESGAVHLTFPDLERFYPTLRECGGFSGLNIPNPIFGWGRLDIERAYEYAVAAPPPLRAPLLPTKPVPSKRVILPRA